MSTATTITLHTATSADNLQHAQFYQNPPLQQQQQLPHNITSKNNSSIYYYQFPSLDTAEERLLTTGGCSGDAGGFNTKSNTEDTQLLLERSHSTPASMSLLLTKSSSSSTSQTTFKPKATILIQDSSNGRVNTSLTDSESDFGAALNLGGGDADSTEQDSFLPGAQASNSGNARRNTANNRLYSKSKTKNICFRTHAFITRNWYLSYLVPLSILLALMFVAYLTRDYAKQLLYWIETQNPWVIFTIFMVLFTVVSFPVVVGYFVLMITSGYLFGFIKGFLTVILGANLGIAIAHVTIRSLRHRIPMHKLIKNETGRAILRVISGPRAFKVVLFTRLTPIPFGIQNAIFGVSTINPRIYHAGSFLGLLPAQTINVYLGSTLRSMHEVLNNHGTALTGYITFGIEVICGVALMFWVVQKARKELSETLLSDISTDGKLIDIQV